ncbi:hypothetical protein AVEN_244599-1 [Araneus ventricosus]|uniref:Uncharacterized protein n=1 Tax=Araneus ventricosus TaxID=182803 RepID=A0A4Y2W603_ARAVE|nr:hypothetical protein AVEN_244599-1 [Araneus ventricosus]
MTLDYFNKPSLVIFTSRFEATRGLFYNGPCHFEPWSDDEDSASTGTRLFKRRTTPAGGRFAPTYDFAGGGLICAVGSGLEPEALRSEAETLPLSHHGFL